MKHSRIRQYYERPAGFGGFFQEMLMEYRQIRGIKEADSCRRSNADRQIGIPDREIILKTCKEDILKNL